jgi:hypothetical protein
LSRPIGVDRGDGHLLGDGAKHDADGSYQQTDELHPTLARSGTELDSR